MSFKSRGSEYINFLTVKFIQNHKDPRRATGSLKLEATGLTLPNLLPDDKTVQLSGKPQSGREFAIDK